MIKLTKVQLQSSLKNLLEQENRKYSDKQLIHHSDEGFQYCNPIYTTFAENNRIKMSMTE